MLLLYTYLLYFSGDVCIEKLITITDRDSSELLKIDSQPAAPDQSNDIGTDMNELRVSYQGSIENAEFSDDADVLIESEEVQCDLLQPYQNPEPVEEARPPQRPQPCSGTIPKTTIKLIHPPVQNSMNQICIIFREQELIFFPHRFLAACHKATSSKTGAYPTNR